MGPPPFQNIEYVLYRCKKKEEKREGSNLGHIPLFAEDSTDKDSTNKPNISLQTPCRLIKLMTAYLVSV